MTLSLFKPKTQIKKKKIVKSTEFFFLVKVSKVLESNFGHRQPSWPKMEEAG